ncbi:MAG: zinc ribbon domain-containing protein [Candidatus Thermoplasmatota archaeon]
MKSKLAVVILVILFLPMFAQGEVVLKANILEEQVEPNAQVTVITNITNTALKESGQLLLLFYFFKGATPFEPTKTLVIPSIQSNSSIEQEIKLTAGNEGTYTLQLLVYYDINDNGRYDSTIDKNAGEWYKDDAVVVKKKIVKDQAIPIHYIAIPIFICILLAAFCLGYKRMKAKKGKEVEITYQPVTVERKVRGKFPKDYYKFLRERAAKLKPIGLTASGETILGNPPTAVGKGIEEVAFEKGIKKEVKIEKIYCKKCGIELSSRDKACPKCETIEVIESMRKEVEKIKNEGFVVSGAENLLKQADLSMITESYIEAQMYARDALDKAKKVKERALEKEAIPSYEPEVIKARAYYEPTPTREYVEETSVKSYVKGSEAYPSILPPVVAPVKPTIQTKETCSCGQQIKKEWLRCPKCGSSLKIPCPFCNNMISRAFTICPFCTKSLSHKPELKKNCKKCGKEVKQNWKICPYCNTQL